MVEAKSTPQELETNKQWRISVHRYLHIIPQSFHPKNSWCTHSNFTGGFAFNDSMQFWHCCVFFVLPCNSLAEPFVTVALWLGWAGRKMQHESLTAGGQSFQQGQHFKECHTPPEAGGRRETLFGIPSISMYLLHFQEMFASFKQRRKKKAGLFVPETNQCHYKSCSSVRENNHPELSCPDHCQWFSPRMASVLFFQSLPFTPPQCPCNAGPQYSYSGWGVPGPAPPCLPGAPLAHHDAPAQPLRMAGRNTIPSYRNASSNATQQLLTQISTGLSQCLFVTTEIEPNLLVKTGSGKPAMKLN